MVENRKTKIAEKRSTELLTVYITIVNSTINTKKRMKKQNNKNKTAISLVTLNKENDSKSNKKVIQYAQTKDQTLFTITYHDNIM